MRIHIFGASGSGVTTLGKALSQKLNIEYFDSDDFFWLKTDIPFTIKQDPAVRNTVISEKLNNTRHWVFGGSILHWGPDVFPRFDLIVFLYLAPNIRLNRIRKREHERYGDEIIINPERKDKFEKFMDWTKDYDNNTGIANRTLHAHREWLSTINTPLLELSGNDDVQQKIKMILDKIDEEKLYLK